MDADVGLPPLPDGFSVDVHSALPPLPDGFSIAAPNANSTLASGAYAPFKPIINNTIEDFKNSATQTGEAMSEPMNNPAVADWSQHPIMGPLDAAMRGVGKIGNAVGGTMQAAFSPVSGAYTASVEPFIPAASEMIKNNLVPNDPRFHALQAGEQTHQVAQGIGNDLATATGLGMAANQGAANLRQQAGLPPIEPPKNPLQPIINSAKAGWNDNTSRTGFLKSNSSDPNYLAPAAIPPVDPRIAQLVKDASGLGIDVPAQVFNPGVVSTGLDKIGMMKSNDMKSQVTMALSKAMGHQGTPNLDTGTMSGIYKRIIGKMNDFASSADKNGGIPIVDDGLQSIVDNSNSDLPKVNRLMVKIKNLSKNGNLSGNDYQLLTKRDGILDRAMNSSDSDYADSARDFREYLDNKLEKSVHPNDLAAFKEARRQYRTMKIVQPLVESGGVTGQADSATKLFNAVNKNYGSIDNALKYNPQLGKIAQIVNEFPEAVSDAKKMTRLGKLKATIAGDAILASAGAYIGGAPAAAAGVALAPAAFGVGKYLSSDMYKSSLLNKSLPPTP